MSERPRSYQMKICGCGKRPLMVSEGVILVQKVLCPKHAKALGNRRHVQGQRAKQKQQFIPKSGLKILERTQKNLQ